MPIGHIYVGRRRNNSSAMYLVPTRKCFKPDNTVLEINVYISCMYNYSPVTDYMKHDAYVSIKLCILL